MNNLTRLLWIFFFVGLGGLWIAGAVAHPDWGPVYAMISGILAFLFFVMAFVVVAEGEQ